MQEEHVITLADLRYLSIECPQCRTRVILDMQEKSAVAEKYGWFAPQKCPGCQADYDSGLRLGIDRLQQLYKPLLDFPGVVTFRAKP